MRDATATPLDPPALVPVPLRDASPPPEPWADAVTLPRDHPAWQRDALAVSARVRAIIAQLRPVVVRVLSFWDHAVRSTTIGSRRLEIDPSGSYRLR